MQEDVARRTGWTLSAISEIENGKRWRRIWVDLHALAEAIGCKPADFFDLGK